MDCLFCKFVSGEIKTEVVYEDKNILAFKDTNPMSNIHILFIPKKHTRNIEEMCSFGENTNDIMTAITNYVQDHKLNDQGYRIVTNMGEFGGQSIFHTHFHLLAGEKLGKFGA